MKELNEIWIGRDIYGGLYVSSVKESLGEPNTRYIRADIVEAREKIIAEVWEKYQGAWLNDPLDDRDALWEAIEKFMEAKNEQEKR